MENTKTATRTHTTKDQALPNEKTPGPHRHHPPEKAGNTEIRHRDRADRKLPKRQTRHTDHRADRELRKAGGYRHHPAEKTGNAGNGGVDQKPTKSQTRKTAQTHDLAESGT